MKPEIQALFTDEIQARAAGLFGMDTSNIKSLDGFENFVCECYRDNKPYILRMTHSSHRNENLVRAELDWVNYLAENKASVCTPVRSVNNSLTESIDCNGFGIVAAVFEKAAGEMVLRDNMTPQMTRNRGKLIGRIHRLTRDYQPPTEEIRRYQWYEEDDFTNYDQFLDPSDTVVKDRFRELIENIRSIPADNHNFGLIHTDAHNGNQFFDGDSPTLFDFDDSAYDYFAADIAIATFYVVLMRERGNERDQIAKDFVRQFVEGYQEEYQLDKRWREIFPMILKRREMVLYVAVHRAMDINNLDEWGTKFMTGRKDKIIDRVPYLDIDLSDIG